MCPIGHSVSFSSLLWWFQSTRGNRLDTSSSQVVMKWQKRKPRSWRNVKKNWSHRPSPSNSLKRVEIKGVAKPEWRILMLPANLGTSQPHRGVNFSQRHRTALLQWAQTYRNWRLRQVLAQNNIWTMPWPAYSPNINPIKHLWAQITRLV